MRKEEIINGLRTLRGELANNYKDNQRIGFIAGVNKALEFIHSTDEPEVLSQEWIRENVEYAYFDMLDGSGRLSSATAIIKPKKLQNLLVPKQELPVIPNYVAKWISVHHEQFDLYPALKRLENNALSWEDVYEWYRKNTRKFVNAYLTGKYVVEEEQKYTVELPSAIEHDDMWPKVALSKLPNGELQVRKTKRGTGLKLHDKYLLTENEIKDYDERYWPFAVKVEEMEG